MILSVALILCINKIVFNGKSIGRSFSNPQWLNMHAKSLARTLSKVINVVHGYCRRMLRPTESVTEGRSLGVTIKLRQKLLRVLCSVANLFGPCDRVNLILSPWFLDNLNRHQTILQTFLNFFLNLTLPGVPHLYKQLPNGQYLSDLCKMCNLDANLWKSWIGDHRILTYIFKWERLNTAGHSHPVSIGHWVAPLYNS